MKVSLVKPHTSYPINHDTKESRDDNSRRL
jgi:hypothetical protein